jgi:hypothetical protein
MATAHPVKAGLLAYACLEEPDALIALVRVCGGAPRVTGGLYPEKTRKLAAVLNLTSPIPAFPLVLQPIRLLHFSCIWRLSRLLKVIPAEGRSMSS